MSAKGQAKTARIVAEIFYLVKSYGCPEPAAPASQRRADWLGLGRDGRTGDLREAERLYALGIFAEHLWALYTNLVSGEPLEA